MHRVLRERGGRRWFGVVVELVGHVFGVVVELVGHVFGVVES